MRTTRLLTLLFALSGCDDPKATDSGDPATGTTDPGDDSGTTDTPMPADCTVVDVLPRTLPQAGDVPLTVTLSCSVPASVLGAELVLDSGEALPLELSTGDTTLTGTTSAPPFDGPGAFSASVVLQDNDGEHSLALPRPLHVHRAPEDWQATHDLPELGTSAPVSWDIGHAAHTAAGPILFGHDGDDILVATPAALAGEADVLVLPHLAPPAADTLDFLAWGHGIPLADWQVGDAHHWLLPVLDADGSGRSLTIHHLHIVDGDIILHDHAQILLERAGLSPFDPTDDATGNPLPLAAEASIDDDGRLTSLNLMLSGTRSRDGKPGLATVYWRSGSSDFEVESSVLDVALAAYKAVPTTDAGTPGVMLFHGTGKLTAQVLDLRGHKERGSVVLTDLGEDAWGLSTLLVDEHVVLGAVDANGAATHTRVSFKGVDGLSAETEVLEFEDGDDLFLNVGGGTDSGPTVCTPHRGLTHKPGSGGKRCPSLIRSTAAVGYTVVVPGTQPELGSDHTAQTYLRLTRRGTRNRPHYRITPTDSGPPEVCPIGIDEPVAVHAAGGPEGQLVGPLAGAQRFVESTGTCSPVVVGAAGGWVVQAAEGGVLQAILDDGEPVALPLRAHAGVATTTSGDTLLLTGEVWTAAGPQAALVRVDPDGTVTPLPIDTTDHHVVDVQAFTHDDSVTLQLLLERSDGQRMVSFARGLTLEGLTGDRLTVSDTAWTGLLDGNWESMDLPLVVLPTGLTETNALDGVDALAAHTSASTGAELVAVLPHDETACPVATWLIPHTTTDLRTDLASAVLLSTSDAADCTGLSVPLAAVDLAGDGAGSVAMTDLVDTEAEAQPLWMLHWDGRSLVRPPALWLPPFSQAEVADLAGDTLSRIIIEVSVPDGETKRKKRKPSRMVVEPDGSALGHPLSEDALTVDDLGALGDRLDDAPLSAAAVDGVGWGLSVVGGDQGYRGWSSDSGFWLDCVCECESR